MPRNFVTDTDGGLINVYHVARFVPIEPPPASIRRPWLATPRARSSPTPS